MINISTNHPQTATGSGANKRIMEKSFYSVSAVTSATSEL